jgi:hypothetical protein
MKNVSSEVWYNQKKHINDYLLRSNFSVKDMIKVLIIRTSVDNMSVRNAYISQIKNQLKTDNQLNDSYKLLETI